MDTSTSSDSQMTSSSVTFATTKVGVARLGGQGHVRSNSSGNILDAASPSMTRKQPTRESTFRRLNPFSRSTPRLNAQLSSDNSSQDGVSLESASTAEQDNVVANKVSYGYGYTGSAIKHRYHCDGVKGSQSLADISRLSNRYYDLNKRRQEFHMDSNESHTKHSNNKDVVAESKHKRKGAVKSRRKTSLSVSAFLDKPPKPRLSVPLISPLKNSSTGCFTLPQQVHNDDMEVSRNVDINQGKIKRLESPSTAIDKKAASKNASKTSHAKNTKNTESQKHPKLAVTIHPLDDPDSNTIATNATQLNQTPTHATPRNNNNALCGTPDTSGLSPSCKNYSDAFSSVPLQNFFSKRVKSNLKRTKSVTKLDRRNKMAATPTSGGDVTSAATANGDSDG